MIYTHILYISGVCCVSLPLFSHLPPASSLLWEAALGTMPCHINMRTGEMFPPRLPHAAVEAAAHVTGYGRSCLLVVS